MTKHLNHHLEEIPLKEFEDFFDKVVSGGYHGVSRYLFFKCKKCEMRVSYLISEKNWWTYCKIRVPGQTSWYFLELTCEEGMIKDILE